MKNLEIDDLVLPASMPRLDVIYSPKGEAGEFAPLATNPYRGCGHGCTYGYCAPVLHMKVGEFNAGATLKANYLQRLAKDAAKCAAAGLSGQIHMCFSTDPYHPADTTATREAIKILHENGLGVSILTKGGTRALRDLDLFLADRDCFGCTLTCLDADVSREWEPNAALPADRIAALKAFHNAGIYTWASLEPTLDADTSLAIVKTTHTFVDLYKVGKLNYRKSDIDWRDYTSRMVDLCTALNANHYIKRDLAGFLPTGYHNPMRVVQHH